MPRDTIQLPTPSNTAGDKKDGYSFTGAGGATVKAESVVLVDVNGTPLSTRAGAAAATDTALVVAAHPSSPMPAAQSGTWTVQPGNTANTTPWLTKDQFYTPSSLAVTATGAAGAAVTLTIPAATGLFHYLTLLEIVRYATAAITGTATPVVVTTTNLPCTPAFTFATAAAVGTADVRSYVSGTPLRSAAAGTATTIVCPAIASVIWRVNAVYFTQA